MTDAALPLQSEADQRAIAAIRRKNAIWRRILSDPPAAVAALFLIVIVGAALLAPWIAPFDPYASNMRLRLCPIGGARCPDFLLGADNQGRDMVSRILFGLRATLGIGIVAVAVVSGRRHQMQRFSIKPPNRKSTAHLFSGESPSCGSYWTRRRFHCSVIAHAQ